ncbi:FMN-dependent NADH-azoreductase [Mycoplasma sp. 1654_15]|uniref:FMN-dependent NADH-azoreductase n=1 Tax=Mycoplasma sp. 1654_15 TaxID=2725994 RepID=UPI00144A279E|nr:FMN-dependent NADH-azoreductase [Mycoplasma sp. 1654_15]QJB71278.1 FMN-dependent NADH-azoreductase [Mycoplasma sp. 1654_15]
MKILLIETALTENSTTKLMSHRFIEFYKEKHPDVEVIEWDINKTEIGKISLNSENFATFWKDVEADKYIEELKTVDKIVFGAPIINVHYSANAKNFFDAICLADKTFSYKYSKKGDAIGLLDNIKNVQILTSQGFSKKVKILNKMQDTIAGTWKFLGAKHVQPTVTVYSAPGFASKEEAVKSVEEELKKAAQTF